ncbi:hypothetical protein JAAARDRAFT_28068 [Jaapia argillacea MUCL 33604]|uniref:Uncharacterized protein n=1 Tax=Jaapia argillacea MUCL 33604 TaxID=933084 RepID=A0A067QP97_9AGAM|nr:hypothetical protein JAAARDRAFT_28068 [Jaapia argillacea MUCL 33604]
MKAVIIAGVPTVPSNRSSIGLHDETRRKTQVKWGMFGRCWLERRFIRISLRNRKYTGGQIMRFA